MPVTLEERIRAYADTLDRAAVERCVSYELHPAPVSATPAGGRRRSLAVALACAAIVVVAAVGIAFVDGSSDRRTAVPGDASAPEERAGNPVSWATEQVQLTADDLRIVVDGIEFVADDPAIEVSSDPGDESYQTLELTWMEHGVEMRWYLYFRSDGTDWWVDEMRTYDGEAAGEWVTFAADFFRTPLGEVYEGDLDVTYKDHGASSRLLVSGLRLTAFANDGTQPPASAGAGAGPATATATSAVP